MTERLLAVKRHPGSEWPDEVVDAWEFLCSMQDVIRLPQGKEPHNVPTGPKEWKGAIAVLRAIHDDDSIWTEANRRRDAEGRYLDPEDTDVVSHVKADLELHRKAFHRVLNSDEKASLAQIDTLPIPIFRIEARELLKSAQEHRDRKNSNEVTEAFLHYELSWMNKRSAAELRSAFDTLICACEQLSEDL